MGATTEYEVVAPSQVGWGEAENLQVLEGAELTLKTVEQRRKRLVEIKGVTLQGTLPEQGSWHYERKRAILAAHPEVAKLFGTNPWTAAMLVVVMSAHVWLSVALVGAPVWVMLGMAYTVGALLSLQCAVIGHEGAHKLVFKSAVANKLLACVAFAPVVMGPFGNFWAVEHMYHHQVIVDKMQRYGPQTAGPVRKAIAAALFFPVVSTFFSLISVLIAARALVSRVAFAFGLAKEAYPKSFTAPPYKTFPQIVGDWLLVNTFVNVAFNVAVYSLYGWEPIVFMFLAASFSNGLHPLGMRQVQEHYLQRRNQPTYSVYSPWAAFTFNIGAHVEHHDFPSVPWNRLPQIRRIAPEFYDNLFHYASYTEVLKVFLFNHGVPISHLLEEYADVVPDAAKKMF